MQEAAWIVRVSFNAENALGSLQNSVNIDAHNSLMATTAQWKC